MGIDGKLVILCDLFLQPLDIAVLELYDLAALRAYEVVMMLVLMDDLEAGAPLAEFLLLGDPALAQQAQCPVYRGESYGGITPHNFVVQLLRADVPADLQKCLEDQLPLAGMLQVMARDMFAEYLLFSFHLSLSPSLRGEAETIPGV